MASINPKPKTFSITLYEAFWKKTTTNAAAHLNISSFQTAFEKEWNKMCEEFILKSCKLFRSLSRDHYSRIALINTHLLMLIHT